MTLLERVKQNEKAIKKAMIETNWQALNKPESKFILYFNEDNTIDIMEDAAGGHNYRLVGDELASFEYQFFDGNRNIEQHAYKEQINEAFENVLNLAGAFESNETIHIKKSLMW